MMNIESLKSNLLAVSKDSNCMRRSVGALIIKDGNIIAAGYNGPSHDPDACRMAGCYKELNNIASGTRHELCRGVHAEQSAINMAARTGVDINNTDLYCTTKPCCMCAKSIVDSGIKRVYYIDEYNDLMSEDILKSIELIRI